MRKRAKGLRSGGLVYSSTKFDLAQYTKNYLKSKPGEVKIYTKDEIKTLESSRKKKP
jgi:hypothetical protein